MRKTILALVALSPMLMHAQVNSPAQPQSAGKIAVLESRLTTPKAPGVTPVAAAATATPVRISSGVKFPKLLETAQIVESADWHWVPTESERLAVVKLTVDANGAPTNVKVVKSLGANMDADVVAAVSHYRFTPGTLNNEPIPVDVDLTVKILSRLQ